VRSFTLGFLLLSALLCAAQGQNLPASDPQAVALAAQSISAISGKTNISDVTLTGNGTWNGRDDGTFTLLALGGGESRVDLVLSGGTRTEIRDAQTGVSLGTWIAPSGLSGQFAYHNCLTDAAWFFPALGSLAATPNVVLTYVGQETRNGAAVQHLHSYVYQAGQTSILGSQQLSAMDFYLDATTLLPVATTFNAHPDNDANTNLLIEIDFANYQLINGVAIPTNIQRYQQGNLMFDLVVTGAFFNSGLPLSQFAVN
jgi:hypothetical protein